MLQIRIMHFLQIYKKIMLPRMEEFKTAVFTRRIIALNESFVPVGTRSSCFPLAVLWHEGVAGRKKDEIISAFYQFFLQRWDQEIVTL